MISMGIVNTIWYDQILPFDTANSFTRTHTLTINAPPIFPHHFRDTPRFPLQIHFENSAINSMSIPQIRYIILNPSTPTSSLH